MSSRSYAYVSFAALLVLLSIGQELSAQATKPKDAIIGNWELVSFASAREDSALTERPMTGRIMYDDEGNMAAQLMPGGEADENGRRRYIAYFGKYELDTEKSEVNHHVKASVFDRWVDSTLTRRYEFSTSDAGADRLTLSVWDGATETTRLVWERLSD